MRFSRRRVTHHRLFRGRSPALPLLSRSHCRFCRFCRFRRFCRIAASAEGVGALLAGDLARSGSKSDASVDQTNLALSPHDRFALNRRQAGLLRPSGRIKSHPVRSAAFAGAHLPAIGGGSVYASMADPLLSRASSLPQGLFRLEGICRSRRTSPLLPKACRARLLLPKSHHRIPASAEGVGALLAGDLARSGSKPGRLGGSDKPRPQPP